MEGRANGRAVHQSRNLYVCCGMRVTRVARAESSVRAGLAAGAGRDEGERQTCAPKDSSVQ